MTAGSASATMPPNERCAASPSAGRHGCSAAPIAAGARAAIYTLIGTAKLNDVDPQAWLADVLERIAGHPPRACPRSYLELAPASVSAGSQGRLNPGRSSTPNSSGGPDPADARLSVDANGTSNDQRLQVMRMFKKGQFSLWIGAVGGGTEAHFIERLLASTPEPAARPGHHTPTVDLCHGALRSAVVPSRRCGFR